MATNEKAAKKSETKAERKVRTDAERIADAERQLKELRDRAEKKANRARDEAWARRAKLVTRRDELNAKIEEIDQAYPQPEDEPLPLEGSES